MRAAIAAGDIARAGQVAEAALEEGQAHPLLFKMRGLRNEGRGRFEEAAADFRAALGYEPNDAGSLNALGLCLARLGRLPRRWPSSTARWPPSPTSAAPPTTAAWALEALGELAQARAGYERAAELDPGEQRARSPAWPRSPRARATSPAARERADAALKLDPQDPTAIMALAIADNGERRFAEAEARLRRCSPSAAG